MDSIEVEPPPHLAARSSSVASSQSSIGSGSATPDSVSSDGSVPLLDAGEYAVLLRTLEDEKLEVAIDKGLEEEETTVTTTSTSKSSILDHPPYGKPLSVEEAAELVPDEEGGLDWYATIIPDDFIENGKLMRGLNPRDFDLQTKSIKPRRPSMIVRATDFFTSLTKLPDSRYIFNGVMNGWSLLRHLELIKLEMKRSLVTNSIGTAVLAHDVNGVTDKLVWSLQWDKETNNGKHPQQVVNTRDGKKRIFRAKLRSPQWSYKGWSKDSPGFCFWYEPHKQQIGQQCLSYGTNMLHQVGDDKCTMVHMISHRYAIKKESTKDKLTYHSVILLEWEHGNYCTVVEGAYLNGIAGYAGRSNWYHDKDSGHPLLFQAFPPEMIGPWRTTQAEIRCFDVLHSKNIRQFQEYLQHYSGPDARFVDVHVTFSHETRLTFRSRFHIAQYLLNYIGRDCSYSELKRNCQTFAADLCGFLGGKKNVVPFHPVNRIEYRNRTHMFLYDSFKYDSSKVKNNKKKHHHHHKKSSRHRHSSPPRMHLENNNSTTTCLS